MELQRRPMFWGGTAATSPQGQLSHLGHPSKSDLSPTTPIREPASPCATRYSKQVRKHKRVVFVKLGLFSANNATQFIVFFLNFLVFLQTFLGNSSNILYCMKNKTNNNKKICPTQFMCGTYFNKRKAPLLKNTQVNGFLPSCASFAFMLAAQNPQSLIPSLSQ